MTTNYIKNKMKVSCKISIYIFILIFNFFRFNFMSNVYKYTIIDYIIFSTQTAFSSGYITFTRVDISISSMTMT